ncbi:DUF4411 family protein [Agrobacterium tumefaciens]|nr:DUF4411 family protein [Agrobacterium tumefaciens]
MKLLLDSNIFIEAKNRYYAFDICPGFWEWMDSVCGTEVGTIVNVRDELIEGKDELAVWAKDRRDADWFLSVDDDTTQENFTAVVQAVVDGGYKEIGVEKFLAKADPWLIAKAMTIGATIITHEVIEPHSKRRVPIPNVCEVFGVPCVNTFDALRKYSTIFKLG